MFAGLLSTFSPQLGLLSTLRTVGLVRDDCLRDAPSTAWAVGERLGRYGCPHALFSSFFLAFRNDLPQTATNLMAWRRLVIPPSVERATACFCSIPSFGPSF